MQRLRRLVAPLLLFLVTACGNESAGPVPPPPPPPPDAPLPRPLLLVVNKGDNSLSIFDPTERTELRRAPTRLGPHEVAVSPDGRRAYVSDYGSFLPGFTVTIIDLVSGDSAGSINLRGNRQPHGIAVASDGNVWVTTEGTRLVLELDPDERTVLRGFDTGQQITHMLALAENAGRVYTANIGSGNSTAIDVLEEEVLAQILTGAGAEGIDVSPDQTRVYVTNREAGTLSEIDVATNQVTRTLGVGNFPIRVKVRPDGSEALVTNALGQELAAVDLVGWEVVRRLPLPGPPVGLLIRPDDRVAFVAIPQANRVEIVDLVNWSVVDEIPTRDQPDGLAWVP